MTTAKDDSRLGRLEGRVEEQSAAMQETRQDARGGFERIDARFDRVDARFDRMDARMDRLESRVDQTNSRIDRLFLAAVGIGAAQVALFITVLVRGG